MATIPEELLRIIFSGLPVKSLLRFRCLSKSTCSLIDNADFAKLHLDQSVSNESDLCLVIDDLKPTGTVRFVDVDLDDNYLLQLHRELIFDYENPEAKFFGSCNGLVALYEGSMYDLQGIILRNPSTNKQQLVGNFWGDVKHCDTILDGFGYDSVNDDYKLVRVRQCRRDQTAKAVVYSSRARVSRTLPDCPYVYAPIFAGEPGIYVAGNLHWIYDEALRREQMIIGFNLTTETFHIVPPPIPQNYFSTLGALGGFLAKSSYSPTTYDCEIWVMKEYSVAASWTKLVRISRAEQEAFGDITLIMRALYLTRKEDRVLLEINRGHLYWYNIVLGRIEYFQAFANVPWSTFYSHLTSRSLVSLPEAEN